MSTPISATMTWATRVRTPGIVVGRWAWAGIGASAFPGRASTSARAASGAATQVQMEREHRAVMEGARSRRAGMSSARFYTSHIATVTSASGPGTLRTGLALRTGQTGVRYTSVASMATCVQRCDSSPSARGSKPAGGVAKWRTCWMRRRGHPPHAGHDGVLVDVQTSTARVEHVDRRSSSRWRRREEPPSSKSTSRALGSRDPWPEFGVLAGLRVQLLIGPRAPSQGRPRSQRRFPSYSVPPRPAPPRASSVGDGRSRPMENY